MAARITEYFCRVEGDSLVCVVRMEVDERFIQVEFTKRLEDAISEYRAPDGTMGC
jgi:hypothetical protein